MAFSVNSLFIALSLLKLRRVFFQLWSQASLEFQLYLIKTWELPIHFFFIRLLPLCFDERPLKQLKLLLLLHIYLRPLEVAAGMVLSSSREPLRPLTINPTGDTAPSSLHHLGISGGQDTNSDAGERPGWMRDFKVVQQRQHSRRIILDSLVERRVALRKTHQPTAERPMTGCTSLMVNTSTSRLHWLFSLRQ